MTATDMPKTRTDLTDYCYIYQALYVYYNHDRFLLDKKLVSTHP